MFANRESTPASGWDSGTTDKSASYMDGFYASSDRKVDQITGIDPIASKSFKGSFEIISKKYAPNLLQLQYALETISKPKIIYLLSEGHHEERLTKMFEIKSKIANPNVSGILFDYFRNLIKTLKEGGAIINAINPDRLKTASYTNTGAMNLQFLTRGCGQYFEGSITKNLIKNIIKKTSAYYEIVYHMDSNINKKQEINVTYKIKGIRLITPKIIEKETPYNKMNVNLKKMFALNVATKGSWSSTVSNIKKIRYKRVSKEKKGQGYELKIDINIPQMIQNQLNDIFIIGLDRKKKRYKIKVNTKKLSKKESISIFKNTRKKIEIYFVIINSQTGDSIYNQIKIK